MHKPVVLITGSEGRIGSAIRAALADAYSVVGFERACKGGDCINADITSDAALDDAFARLRERYGNRLASVIHLAAFYEQNLIGRLVHGEPWDTRQIPKSMAATGAWLRDRLEDLIPDAIDRGSEPFIKPFMVPLADDHYELDTERAQRLLGWKSLPA